MTRCIKCLFMFVVVLEVAPAVVVVAAMLLLKLVRVDVEEMDEVEFVAFRADDDNMVVEAFPDDMDRGKSNKFDSKSLKSS